MPSIMDMVEVMERLESKALHVRPQNCSKVRNRNSVCSRCADACPSGAITLQGNTIGIDAERCMACGACASACPTSALMFQKPTDEELSAALSNSVEALGGHAVAVCARVEAHKSADMGVVASAPCLSRFDASVLIGAVVAGARDITLVGHKCESCKYRKTIEGFHRTVAEANALLEAWESDARVRVVQEVPEAARAQTVEATSGGVSRRGFFTDVRTSARGLAAETAKVTLENELGIKKEPATLQAMLRVDENGDMPRVSATHHEELLESLYELGEPVPDTQVETRLWGSVKFNAEACDNCGVCATFCSTGALSKVFGEPERKRKPPVVALEFRLADCVQCRLCESACIHKAITVESVLDCSRILEFEPVELRGTKEKRKAGMLGRR